MGEYETASLAIQEATLALRREGLIAAYVQAGATLLVGLAQCGLIAWGIKKIDASNQRRERQEAQAEARHEETMLALQQQGEAMRTLRERQEAQAEARHEETMLALQQQGEAMRTLRERTAPQK